MFGSTKNRKVRSVAIPKALVDILAAHLSTHDRDTVFPDSNGGTLRVSNFRSHFLKACSEVGIEPIRNS